MDAEKINRAIHEWLGRGEDWHEFEWEAGESDCQRCSKNIVDHLDAFPDYTTDLNAVREAELKCIEEFGRDAYLNALTDQVVVLGDFNERDTDDLAIATASALTRAQAVCDVLEGK